MIPKEVQQENERLRAAVRAVLTFRAAELTDWGDEDPRLFSDAWNSALWEVRKEIRRILGPLKEYEHPNTETPSST